MEGAFVTVFREATNSDREEFLYLWSEMYEELLQYGSEHEPDLNTLRDARNLFDAYVTGELDGVALLYEPPGETPQGVAFGGEAFGTPAIRGTHLGRIANGWGIYIRKEHRSHHISTLIQTAIRKRLLRMGFDTVLGDVLVTNKAGIGSVEAVGDWEPYAIIYKYDLKGWKDDTIK